MKLYRLLTIFFFSAACLSCSEYDDSALREEIEQLKQRVLALEQANANANIASLWEIVNSLKDNNKSVSNVATFSDASGSGYQIFFSDNTSIKLYNGKDGADAPVVGVRAIAGVYYWTLTINGSTSYILDDKGNRIPTTGQDAVSPQLKVENGYWMLSSDGGKTWTQLAAVTDGLSNFFSSVMVMGDEVYITTADGTVLVLPFRKVDRSSSFDPESIVLSIAAISDTHIGNNYGSEAKFTSALQQLKAKAAEKDPNGLDAVMVVGDLVNNANQSQVSTFKTLYEQVFDPVKVPMIYTIGNHDMNPNYRWTESTVSQNKTFENIFGDDYFLTDQDQTMRQNFECRHCVVGSCHIVAVTPYGTSPITYDGNTLTWLNNTLKSITEADPSHYVLLITHPMIYNTVYGSLLQDTYTSLGEYWSTKALSSILSQYPQVVTFGGHLHFPLNDPRSVWQGEFTSFGCASTSYMAIENGNYEDMSSTTVMKDAGEYSQGLLVQLDLSGNMRVTRMDFYHQTEIGSAWTMSYPAADKSHLDKYNHNMLRSVNTGPSLSEATVSVGSLSGGAAAVSLEFAAGTDDEFVHHYLVTVKQGVTTITSKKILADFYRAPQPSQMKDSYSLQLGNLAQGSYTLSIVAVDSWDVQSTPLVKEFEVGASSNAVWVPDEAGNRALEGGSGSVSNSFASYSNGTLSWTANNSGAVRETTLSLPSGKSVTVRQLGPAEFKGTWSFRTQRFSNNTAVASVAADITFDVTVGEPLGGETLTDHDGATITNNIGLRGLYLDAVVDGSVDIDYNARTLRFGLFLDERKAQAVANGNSTYPYVCFIPECGTGWIQSPWNFVPKPINASKNYTWLWFTVSEDLKTLNYDQPNMQYLPGTSSGANLIIGITCAVCKNATPAADDIFGTYNVIYQANPNKVLTNGGFTLKKK